MFSQFLCNSSIVVALPLWLAIANLNGVAIAQITPDNTLGSEHSVINRDLQIRGALGDRIDGGAIRGSHLFHSFSDFNVNELQRVYFSNPGAIHNIISRVTGSAPSDIFGTLGVLGEANLFLINPNGIVFGPDATLDINGSFLASTTDGILFDSGYLYSATDPDGPPLLNVTDQIAGLNRWLPQSGSLQSQAALAVGGELNLLAASLNLQGEAIATQDINLIATQELTATDTPTRPFIASAGGDLLFQGNQSLTLSALDHPASQIHAIGDLTLRSPTPIVGDATFTAGGDTRIERLNGRLGSLISIGDPVFETAGNFAVDSYTGASLQILAGGSVTIPGTITIASAGGPFNDSTVTLSNGSTLALTGTTEPTVDIRAGTTEFFGTPDSGRPTRADITIGTIVNPGGLVYLSNRFAPNPDLAGNITINVLDTTDFGGGGDVVIDSKGGITFDVVDVSGGNSADFDFESNGLEVFGGDGGDVTLLAGGEILMPLQSFLLSYGLRGGSIILDSDTAITQEEGPEGAEFFELSTIEAIGVGPEDSGNVRLSAPDILIGGNIFVDTYGAGDSGNLTIRGDRLLARQASINTDTFFGSGDAGDVRVRVGTLELGSATQMGSNSISFDGGATGDVVVVADRILATDGAQIASTAFAVGDAGTVTVTANAITLAGFLPIELTGGEISPSLIASVTQPGSVGDSGNVTVNSDRLQVLNGAKIGTSSFGEGNAGTAVVNATEALVIDGAALENIDGNLNVEPSSISSELFAGAIGRGGTVTITTPNLSITNGGLVSALSFGDGDAGDVNIVASDSLLIDGVAPFTDLGGLNRISQISVLAGADSTGGAGTLMIESGSIRIANGARITAESLSQNTAGVGGNIVVRSPDLFLDNGLISTETVSGAGGAIALTVDDVIAMANGSRISATAGTAGAGGDGGNITIASEFLTADPLSNNDITANAFEGRGGNVDITVTGLFGLTPRSRAELEALLGTTDPEQLDPANLPSSDITAISQANPSLDGLVIVRSPDVDPSRSIAALPTTTVDASQLIAQGCSAGGAIAQEVGSLIVTGRGGLPQNPGMPLGYQDLALDWAEVATSLSSTGEIPNSATPAHPATGEGQTASSPLLEVQTLTRRADGQVILAAATPTANPLPPGNLAATCVSPLP